MNCYMRILEEQAEPVKDSINQDRNRVFEVLNTKSYKDAKFNRYLELFKEIMDGAEHCNNVSTLRSYADKAEALKAAPAQRDERRGHSPCEGGSGKGRGRA